MNKTLLTAALATLALALPASATPERKVVAPDEVMVLVPGLEELGYSRLSTVEHCAEVTQPSIHWTELITDSDFENMEACLIEHT